VAFQPAVTFWSLPKVKVSIQPVMGEVLMLLMVIFVLKAPVQELNP